MANLATLKAALNAAIYQNNQNAITGEALNTILNSIIDTLGTGYRYAGVATPSANPGTIDNRVFYFATAAGTYTNFGAVQLDGKSLHIFIYDTTWHDVALDVPTTAALAVQQGSATGSVVGNDPAAGADGDGSVCLGHTYGDGGELSADGDGSIAVGQAGTDDGQQSVAEIRAGGEGSFASGFASGEEGSIALIVSNSTGAHAEGAVNASSNDSSIEASATGAHAEGFAENGGIKASGMGAHAEGYAGEGCTITASGGGAHAEGYAGAGSITASGDGAHAEGAGTVAQNEAEHAEGKYNASHKKTTGTAAEQAAGSTLSSIGCGTSANDRKNAAEVMQNGDLYLKNIGGYDGTNPDSAVCLVPTVMAIEEGDVTESQFIDEDVVPSLTASDVALLRQTPFLKAKDFSGNDISGLFLQIPTALYPTIQEPLPTRIDDYLSAHSYMGFDKIAAIFISSENAETDINNPVYSGRYIVVLRSVAYHWTKYYCAYV